MVLESLLPSKEAREKPHYMFIIAFLFAIVGMWLAYYIFPFSASILTIAFVVIAAEPLIRKTLMTEEEEEAAEPGNPTTFLGRHADLIAMYSWFFLGLIFAYASWYLILPAADPAFCASEIGCGEFPTRDSIFMEQERQLTNIENLRDNAGGGMAIFPITGFVTSDLGENYWGIVEFLFRNNVTVLLLAVFFSFLFGAGALFLISWNATIIGTVIGRISLQALSQMPVHDIPSIIHAFAIGTYQAIGFIPHGIPEILSYYIGAIAGGIISASIAKKAYHSHEFGTIAKDAAILIIIAIVLLFFAATIESYLWLYA
jgi:uncharacterized membrane protein SpoIIM required for sporulation